MNRARFALLALLPAAGYASYEGARSVGPWGLAAAIGVGAALLPLLGLARDDLDVLGWIPGLFLGTVLFVLCGVTVSPIPGPLAGLIGGWAVAAPLFAAIAAIGSDRAPGRRVFLLVLALLAGLAVLAVASAGPAGSPGTFAQAFAQVPKRQALALATVLTGGSSLSAPFLAVPVLPYDALALLAGAGGLVGLLALPGEGEPEAIGHDLRRPDVPEGTYRSLLVEGRSRLAEATPNERPTSAEPAAIVSLFAAALAALGSLLGASFDPDWLIAGTATLVIALLAAILLSLKLPRRPGARQRPRPATGAAPAGEPL